ncbi:MAG TPA: hypothetical protein PKL97_03825 [Candidatus Omnitrophota bacterium]|nr:hypothetical protein [Candidatus Omnitrophota bacterium]
MIRVNLLPAELRKKKLAVPPPFKLAGWVLLGLLLAVWGLNLYSEAGLSTEIGNLKLERQGMTEDLSNADKLIAEMNQDIVPKKTFLERFEMPECQWDQILNLLSDALPDNLWLSALRLDDSDRIWLRAEGFAKPEKDRAEMQSIGEFIVAVKRKLEMFIGQLGTPKRSLFNVETSTEQKQWDQVPVTQFVIEFRRSGEGSS